MPSSRRKGTCKRAVDGWWTWTWSKFFDRVNHDVLMAKLAKRIDDRRRTGADSPFLEAGILANGVTIRTIEGTPQGGPLSPLLANVLLDEVDKELEKRGHAFVRYADDCNVYVRSQRAGERVMGLLRKLYTRLRLRINEAKSAIDLVWNRKILGYSFALPQESQGEMQGRGQGPKRNERPRSKHHVPNAGSKPRPNHRGTAGLSHGLEGVLQARENTLCLSRCGRMDSTPNASTPSQTLANDAYRVPRIARTRSLHPSGVASGKTLAALVAHLA